MRDVHDGSSVARPGTDADLPGSSGTGIPGIDISGIDVDVTGIDEFVALLRDEVTQNLRPYTEQIIDAHRSGVTFGQSSGSEAMLALRKDYYRCLYSGTDGLRSYIEASEVLIAAAERIAAAYRHTDAMAEAKTHEVLAALNVAGNDINARQQATIAADALHESDREARRNQR